MNASVCANKIPPGVVAPESVRSISGCFTKTLVTPGISEGNWFPTPESSGKGLSIYENRKSPGVGLLTSDKGVPGCTYWKSPGI